MKILFITDNFPPEKNALANRSFINSKILSKDFDTTVITCFPNYPYGKIFKGFKKKNKIENDQKLKIIRLPSYISKKNNGLRNFIDYLSFGIIAFLRSLFLRKNIIYTSSPPVPVALCAILLSKLTLTKSILEVRDLWADSIKDLGISKNKFSLLLIKFLEKIMFKMADQIYCVTESMKQNLIEQKISKNKILVMPNGYIHNNYEYYKKDKKVKLNRLQFHFYKYKKYLNLSFIGTIGESQDFDMLEKIALRFRNKKVIFTLIGNGSKFEELNQKIIKKNIRNIFLFKTSFESDESDIYKNIKFGFSFLKKNRTFKTVIPSKIYDYLGHDIFILFNGPEGEATNFVQKNKIGMASSNLNKLTSNINLLIKRKKI